MKNPVTDHHRDLVSDIADSQPFDPERLQALINAFHANTSHDIQGGTTILEGLIQKEEAKINDLGDVYGGR